MSTSVNFGSSDRLLRWQDSYFWSIAATVLIILGIVAEVCLLLWYPHTADKNRTYMGNSCERGDLFWSRH